MSILIKSNHLERRLGIPFLLSLLAFIELPGTPASLSAEKAQRSFTPTVLKVAESTAVSPVGPEQSRTADGSTGFSAPPRVPENDASPPAKVPFSEIADPSSVDSVRNSAQPGAAGAPPGSASTPPGATNTSSSPASAPPGAASTPSGSASTPPGAKSPPDRAAAADSTALPELGKLQALETRLFSRAFSLDSTVDRLSRLEKFVFGVEGKGDSALRMEKLLKVFGKSAAPSESSQSAAGAELKTSATVENPKALLSIINQGIDNYNRHRFHNAEDDFNEALNIAPGMSRIHVYLGTTLLQLNERKAALDAMNAAYELDPFGTYGRYAKHCLVVLMGDEEIRKRGPKDDMKTVQKTLETVNQHADFESQRHRAMGQSLASARTKFYSSPNRDMGSGSYIRGDSMVQQIRARQDAAQRAANTQEAANNLKSLISSKALPGDAKLRAFGTTLNARYYGSETYNLAPWYIPREAVQELKAQPVLLKAARPLARTGRDKAASKQKQGKPLSSSQQLQSRQVSAAKASKNSKHQ